MRYWCTDGHCSVKLLSFSWTFHASWRSCNAIHSSQANINMLHCMQKGRHNPVLPVLLRVDPVHQDCPCSGWAIFEMFVPLERSWRNVDIDQRYLAVVTVIQILDLRVAQQAMKQCHLQCRTCVSDSPDQLLCYKPEHLRHSAAAISSMTWAEYWHIDVGAGTHLYHCACVHRTGAIVAFLSEKAENSCSEGSRVSSSSSGVFKWFRYHHLFVMYSWLSPQELSSAKYSNQLVVSLLPKKEHVIHLQNVNCDTIVLPITLRNSAMRWGLQQTPDAASAFEFRYDKFWSPQEMNSMNIHISSTFGSAGSNVKFCWPLYYLCQLIFVMFSLLDIELSKDTPKSAPLLEWVFDLLWQYSFSVKWSLCPLLTYIVASCCFAAVVLQLLFCMYLSFSFGIIIHVLLHQASSAPACSPAYFDMVKKIIRQYEKLLSAVQGLYQASHPEGQALLQHQSPRLSNIDTAV